MYVLYIFRRQCRPQRLCHEEGFVMVRSSARRVPPGFTERAGTGDRDVDPYTKPLEERAVLRGTPIDETAAPGAR
jgi:hypothetical protein